MYIGNRSAPDDGTYVSVNVLVGRLQFAADHDNACAEMSPRLGRAALGPDLGRWQPRGRWRARGDREGVDGGPAMRDLARAAGGEPGLAGTGRLRVGRVGRRVRFLS